MPESRPVIVVGYDGSLAARAAVEAGIDRLGSTGHLVVVHAYHVPADYVGASYYQEMLDDHQGRAKGVMDDLAGDCERLASVDWESDLVVGSAGDAICRVAETRSADEIVIGTRGYGHLRAALGSVSLDVLHRATCPVLVIPGRTVEQTQSEQAAMASAV